LLNLPISHAGHGLFQLKLMLLVVESLVLAA
jgi:hypothetical protein